jgi:peptide/nickel transport system substrate-binding protein
MDRAAVEPDIKKRAELYHELQKKVVEASPLIWVMELNFVTVYNKKLHDFLVSPLGLYSSFAQAWMSK